MEAFTSIMTSINSDLTGHTVIESNSSLTSRNGWDGKESSMSSDYPQGTTDWEVACGYDDLLEENQALRSILEQTKSMLTAAEASIEKQEKQRPRGGSTASTDNDLSQSNSQVHALTRKLNEIVISKKKLIFERNTLRKHNAEQAEIGKHLSAQVKERENEVLSLKNELLNVMPLKLCLEELKNKNSKLSNELNSHITELRVTQNTASSMREKKKAAEIEADELRTTVNRLSRRLTACEGERDRQNEARERLEEALSCRRGEATLGVKAEKGPLPSRPRLSLTLEKPADLMKLQESHPHESFVGESTPTVEPTPSPGTGTGTGTTRSERGGLGVESSRRGPGTGSGEVNLTLTGSSWWACLPVVVDSSDIEGNDDDSFSTYNSEDYEHHRFYALCSPPHKGTPGGSSGGGGGVHIPGQGDTMPFHLPPMPPLPPLLANLKPLLGGCLSVPAPVTTARGEGDAAGAGVGAHVYGHPSDITLSTLGVDEGHGDNDGDDGGDSDEGTDKYRAVISSLSLMSPSVPVVLGEDHSALMHQRSASTSRIGTGREP